ncbi:MAG TPA: hypothetical protein VFO52_00935 [Longimicrobiales bacterium]|nr:hypothetical protein [Longimicrobiales bacterium]
MGESGIVPVAFDLSTLVPRSVASLYSHLVTRPTGQALRLGIESQIRELGAFCVSVLDFSQVVVLDYSCADEVIAKLIMNYQRAERPNDAYFVVRGLAEEHTDPIEEVLVRHQLALVAEIDGAFVLLGNASDTEREVWSELQKQGNAEPHELLRFVGCPEPQVNLALDTLHRSRTVLRRANSNRYFSLTSLLQNN